MTNILQGWPTHHPVPKLPLRIRLESITPSQDRVLIIQILIRNIGAEPYALPIGRDGDLKPSHCGRHEFWFGLRAPHEREPFISGQTTFSSADLPDSVMMIPPNGIVQVRFKINTNRANINRWKGEGTKAVPVQASCWDKVYDDNPAQYILRHLVPDTVSENELMLPLN